MNLNEVQPASVGNDMSSAEGRVFKKDPAINVISKEDFEQRVEQVFYLLWSTLSKSFGPYGAPTIIYNFPYSHVTKDGYTIAKNLSMDASETLVDTAIEDMAVDICGRLNYTVGDGTTTAIIATYSIYENYRQNRDQLLKRYILPRDIIRKYGEIKDQIIERLRTKVKPVQSSNLEELKKNISDVVYISSNGDRLITDYISELYEEIGGPSITCSLAPDGVTKKILIDGYKHTSLTLNDRLYINSDNQTMELPCADIVIFGTKINRNTYTDIIKPLNEACKARGRHLIVTAPTYDEMTLQKVIAPELNNEYRKNNGGDINLVLTTYRAITQHTRKIASDFAVLCNTTIIDRNMENEISDKLKSGLNIVQIFNIDQRHIEGTQCHAVTVVSGNNGQSKLEGAIYTDGVDELPAGYQNINETYLPLEDNCIRLGYVQETSLGLRFSQFRNMLYDEKRYQAALEEAEADLKEKEEKYKKLGTFNIEVSQAQERLYALRLKMGLIEVGADTELSQKMLKDSVDDAVRAASSAFHNGVVLGCNVNLIQTINEIIAETEDETTRILLDILQQGFRDVYKTVLGNVFEDKKVSVSCGESLKMGDTWDASPEKADQNNREVLEHDVMQYIYRKLGKEANKIYDRETMREVIHYTNDLNYNGMPTTTVHDALIDYSLATNQVLDVSTFTYSNDVINSVQTDEEILKATIDLMSLLITGNQMVITQKHNFE